MERYEDCIEVANKIEGYGVKSLSSLPVTESFATFGIRGDDIFPTATRGVLDFWR